MENEQIHLARDKPSALQIMQTHYHCSSSSPFLPRHTPVEIGRSQSETFRLVITYNKCSYNMTNNLQLHSP
jgi:hypothetical protein